MASEPAAPPIDPVRLELGTPIVRLVLDRPERRNALSLAVMQALLAALDTIAGDADARVLVIEGRGPAFSAGHDLAEMTSEPRRRRSTRSCSPTCVELMTRLHTIPQPVIAKVHGVATAAGCQLVAACDLAVASDDARFATPGVNIGLFCSTPMVPVARTIGRKRALEMLFTGEMIDARDRARLGTREPGRPADRARRRGRRARRTHRARRARTCSRSASARSTRRTSSPRPPRTTSPCAVMVENAQADDAHEGMRAFLEKRAPQWRNR